MQLHRMVEVFQWIGIYNVQNGAGLGSFFGKLFKMAMPLAQKGINTALKSPIIHSLANTAIDAGQTAAKRKISRLANSAKQRVNKKRKIDELGS